MDDVPEVFDHRNIKAENFRSTIRSWIYNVFCMSHNSRLVRKKIRQIIPIFILFAYSAIGGVVFWHIEGSNAK